MTHIHPAFLEHERKRFIRPDAHRFLRADWRRYMRAGYEEDPLYRFFERIECKYSLHQPRVPRGNPDGGQWTSDGSGTGHTDPRVVSDTIDLPNLGRDTRRTDRAGDLVVSRSMGNRLSPHQGNKRALLLSRRRLRMRFGGCRNWIRNGSRRRARMKVSKVLSERTDLTRVKLRIEFPNYGTWG